MSGPGRHLIVNADDFGLTEGVNRGIVEAHENGIVTSASLMVRYPAAQQAAIYARERAPLSVGLHFDAAEWQCMDGTWRASYEVIDLKDAAQVRREFEAQLHLFENLLGRAPTHLDSHQHVHTSEPARSVLVEYSERLKIPLRSCTLGLTYRGDFYGQTTEGDPLPEGIALVRLETMVESLSPGWTEMGCHPGYADGLASVYRTEREMERQVLCDSKARAAVDRQQVQLSSFHDYAAARLGPDLHCTVP
jgi:predicted glycoside hydrolase/deacetylase ChbG (UPF0249 family)